MPFLVVALALQDVTVEVLEKQKQVVIRVQKIRQGPISVEAAVVSISRLRVKPRGANLERVFVFERALVAARTKDQLQAEISLEPGNYDVGLGSGRTRIIVSKSGLSGCEERLIELRNTADALLRIAVEIDLTAAPGPPAIAGWRARLSDVLGKLACRNPDLQASSDACVAAIGELLQNPKLGGPGPAKPAVADVVELRQLATREAILTILDEAELFTAAPPGSIWINRWSNQQDAFKEILRSYDAAKGPPEGRKLIEDIRDHRDADAISKRLEDIRTTLIKK